MADLKQEMISGKISRLRPFGEELHRGLENARMFEGHAYWVEEDYCSPAFAMVSRSDLVSSNLKQEIEIEKMKWEQDQKTSNKMRNFLPKNKKKD